MAFLSLLHTSFRAMLPQCIVGGVVIWIGVGFGFDAMFVYQFVAGGSRTCVENTREGVNFGFSEGQQPWKRIFNRGWSLGGGSQRFQAAGKGNL